MKREANAEAEAQRRQWKMWAFTRMTNGLAVDLFDDGDLNLFHSQWVSRKKNYSLAGLSERMRKVVFRNELQFVLFPFFDIDLETNEVVKLDDVYHMINTAIFPALSKFFNLPKIKDSPALHMAVYSAMDQGELQPKVTKMLMCGWCTTTKLNPVMHHTTAMFQCHTCGLRFSRTIGFDDSAGRLPQMASFSILLAKYNNKHARKERFLSPPAPWTDMDDESIEFDEVAGTLKFAVGSKTIQVQVGRPRQHVVKEHRKYGIHIKALQTSQANPKAQARHNAMAKKHFAAFQRMRRRQHRSKNSMADFVTFQYQKKRYENTQAKLSEPSKVTHSKAKHMAPSYFGFPLHKMASDDKDLCEHLLGANTIANVAVTQQVFLYFMAYLISQLTKYQTTLEDRHPLKKIDMQKAFDPQPVINGAALRLCLGKFNERKPVKCKCVDVAKDSRKRNPRGGLRAAVNCAHCYGRGYYLDMSRNPMELVRVLVDPHHDRWDDLQRKMDDTYTARLNEEHNLPILLASTSTRVNMKALEPKCNALNGMYADVNLAHVEDCMRGLNPNLIYKKSRASMSGNAVTNQDTLDVVQRYIQNVTDVVAWKGMTIQGLVPFDDKPCPRYSVKIHAASPGYNWCIYKNDEHNSNNIYFVLIPPRADGHMGTMVAACWSQKCSGKWRNSPMGSKHTWDITAKDASLIWPRLHGGTMQMPNLAAAARSAQLVLWDDSQISQVEVAQPTDERTSLRKRLNSNPMYRRVFRSFEYFRADKDDTELQTNLLVAYRLLSLVGS